MNGHRMLRGMPRGMPPALGCAAALLLACSGLFAGEGGEIPDRYHVGLDGKRAQTVAADGKNWSAWAYRNGDEYDIAVSFQTADGRWSEPSFVGLDDGVNQIEPELAADGLGNLFLVFSELDTGRVLLARRPRGDEWKLPAALTPVGSAARAPEVQVVGDKLVIAFRVRNQIKIVAVPIAAPGGTGAVDDGPDPIGRPRK